jgi:hypothetical protein
MDGIVNVIKRYEKKYLISQQQYRAFMEVAENKLKADRYGISTICNIYFDTPDYRLIRASAEKPVYKEKLRVRSYGVPAETDNVFIEIKKKYKGVVYKRRICLTYGQSRAFLNNHHIHFEKSQICNEIDSMIKFYKNLMPAMFISYDRLALYGIQDPQLRITFDKNILARTENLELGCGVWGETLLPENGILMEIKLAGAFPVWLSSLLSSLKIYPQSFSKYHAAYKRLVLNTDIKKGGMHCA